MGATIDWGPINPGQSLTKNLDVNNTKNEPVTPILNATLPAGWAQTWTLNNTVIAAKTNVTGVLTLTAPANATAGPVNIPTTLTP